MELNKEQFFLHFLICFDGNSSICTPRALKPLEILNRMTFTCLVVFDFIKNDFRTMYIYNSLHFDQYVPFLASENMHFLDQQ